MQPSTPFDWGRAVTPARWVAGILGGAPLLLWIGAPLFVWIGSLIEPTGAILWIPSALQYVMWGLLGGGLVLAIFWKGLGEVVGGLALVGGAVWTAFSWVLGIISLEAAALFALSGLLFIACGWYTLAHRSRHATPTMPTAA